LTIGQAISACTTSAGAQFANDLADAGTATTGPRPTVAGMVYDNARETDVIALEKLAAELGGRGFDPVITSAGGRPVLVVSNPDAPALSENILEDGGWFWWPWAERITGVANTGGAADAVARVLAARE
jgi:hypothetical protein